jgi:hypothetical protein
MASHQRIPTVHEKSSRRVTSKRRTGFVIQQAEKWVRRVDFERSRATRNGSGIDEIVTSRARWLLSRRGGFNLAVVGPTGQNFLHAILDQGRHSLRNRHLPKLSYGCARVNQPFYFVTDNQKLVQTDPPSVAALITISAAFAAV